MTDSTPDPLTTALRRLPEPAPPASLEANVMARIARMPSPAQDRLPAPARRRDAFAWTAASAGFAVSLACVASVLAGLIGNAPAPAPAWLAGLDPTSASPIAAACLAGGLLLLAAGLFRLAGMRRLAA